MPRREELHEGLYHHPSRLIFSFSPVLPPPRPPLLSPKPSSPPTKPKTKHNQPLSLSPLTHCLNTNPLCLPFLLILRYASINYTDEPHANHLPREDVAIVHTHTLSHTQPAGFIRETRLHPVASSATRASQNPRYCFLLLLSLRRLGISIFGETGGGQ